MNQTNFQTQNQLQNLEEANEIIKQLTEKLNKMQANQAKSIKNRPSEEFLVPLNDSLPFTSLEKLTQNKLSLDRNSKKILKKIVEERSNNSCNPIILTDLSKVLTQHLTWMEKLPEVRPFYAVKSNNDYQIVKTLKDLGCGFDCASMEEIRQVLEMGVSPSSIIFANPIKPPSHLQYAYKNGVDHMTFDNSDELEKIKKFHPNAKLVIRIRVDDSKSLCQFGAKFGVHSGKTKPLIEKISELEMNLVGVSFHVGSGCGDPKAYYEAIKKSREIFDEAEEFNMKLSLLDIGGGFTSEDFDHHSRVIKESLMYFFGDLKVKVIAEPGRYYCAPSMSMAVNVTGRRTIIEAEGNSNEEKEKEEIDNGKKFMYYVSDGAYGTFNCIYYDHWEVKEIIYLIQNENNCLELKEGEDLKLSKKYISTIWGPTCDSLDVIGKNLPMPEMQIGDWMIFEEFGAYTISAGCEFNGFPRPSIFYIDTRISEEMQTEIKGFYNWEL